MTRKEAQIAKAYDLVTIGMAATYLDNAGYIILPPGIEGDVELAEYALKMSKGFKKYMEENEFGNWDEYIEQELIKEYNPARMQERGIR